MSRSIRLFTPNHQWVVSSEKTARRMLDSKRESPSTIRVLDFQDRRIPRLIPRSRTRRRKKLLRKRKKNSTRKLEKLRRLKFRSRKRKN